MNLQDQIHQALTQAGENQDPSAAIMDVVKQAMTEQDNGLKQKNGELLAQLKELKSKTAAIPDGFDPDEYATLKAEHEKQSLDRMKAENRWEDLRKNLETKHAQDLQAKDQRIASLEQALHGQLIDNLATQELSKAGGNAALLMPHIRSQMRVEETEGRYQAQVVDNMGNTRYSQQRAGEPMSVEELVHEMRQNATFGQAFAPRNSGGNASGSGSGAGARANGDANPFQKGPHWNVTEQVRLKKQNPELAKQLAHQAGRSL